MRHSFFLPGKNHLINDTRTSSVKYIMSTDQQKKKKTPDYFHCIEDKRFRNSVYEPEADTFVFLDGLDAEEAFLTGRFPIPATSIATNVKGVSRRRRIVEIGCGSGTVITHLESILGWASGDEYHVVDVNPLALEAAEMTWVKSVSKVPQSCSEAEGTSLVEPETNEVVGRDLTPPLLQHLGDLFSPFTDADEQPSLASTKVDSGESGNGVAQQPFDVILFNPPYVPTSAKELEEAIHGGDIITAAWCGGPRGRVVVDRFLRALPQWLDPHRGVAYVIAIKENDVQDMIRFIQQDVFGSSSGTDVTVSVAFRRYTSEDLSLLKISRGGSS